MARTNEERLAAIEAILPNLLALAGDALSMGNVLLAKLETDPSKRDELIEQVLQHKERVNATRALLEKMAAANKA